MSETTAAHTDDVLQQTAADLFDPIDLGRGAVTGVVRLTRRWWLLRQADRAERRQWKSLLDGATDPRTTGLEVAEPTVPMQAVPQGSDAWREGRFRFKQEHARHPYWVERVDC